MRNDSQQNANEPFRVLIVDDDEAIRQTYYHVLVDRGYAIATAGSGREALQLLMQHSYDVLVVDLRMEEMDGMVFIQEAMKIWPWIGVIIVSAFISRDVPDRAARMGISRLLAKPIDIDTLVAAIEDEGHEKLTLKTDIPQDRAIALVQEHVRLLTEISHGDLGTEGLAHALRAFGQSLARMVTCDAVGILLIENEQEPLLILAPQTQVSAGFLTAMRQEVLSRFKALSTRPLDESKLHVDIPDSNLDATKPETVGDSLSVPLLMDNQVRGLLTLATVDTAHYTPSDVSLLYHTTHHISAIFEALRRMHGLATLDPLTKLYNRVRLEEELERAWLTSHRYGTPMAVAVFDIDNFKTLNDAYGHAVGDDVLRDYARVIQAAARGTDVVARYGGDEFLAILPQTSESNAQVFARRLLKSTQAQVFSRDKHRLSLTVSIGVATTESASAPSTSAALLSQADRALYAAKRAGRNRICIWPGLAFNLSDASTKGAAETTADASATKTGGQAKPPPSGARVLIVEDEEPIRRLLSLILDRNGHDATAVSNATDATDLLRRGEQHIDLLLTDIGLPDMDGIELMRQVKRIDDSIVPVVMTGHATVDNAIACLREGAYDFIRKPIDQNQLLALIARAHEYRKLKVENERYQAHLESMVRERSAKLAASLQDIRASYEFTLDAMVRMLDAREEQTGRHSKRVRELAVRLAQEVGLPSEQQETIAQGAFLHDIGKIGIPDSILLKPDKLTPAEWKRMQEHSLIGYDILRSSQHLSQVARIVLEHHEHWDGSGYPNGLKGKQISLGARIFAVIDAFDAMRSDRVYRKALSAEESAAEIRRGADHQFDPDVVAAFERCRPDLERIIATPA